jgi:hypothetical protein
MAPPSCPKISRDANGKTTACTHVCGASCGGAKRIVCIFEQVACRRIAHAKKVASQASGVSRFMHSGAALCTYAEPWQRWREEDARMLVAAPPSQPASCQPNRCCRPCRGSLVDTKSASSARAMTPRSLHRAHRQRLLARLAVRPAARAKSNAHGRNLLPMTNYLV